MLKLPAMMLLLLLGATALRAGELDVPVMVGGDCGVTEIIEDRQRYAGNCKSGWVHGKYIEDHAGRPAG